MLKINSALELLPKLEVVDVTPRKLKKGESGTPTVEFKKPRKRTASSASKGKKSPRSPGSGTPLQRFKDQTKLRKKELHIARKKIDKELKVIEKDLGVFKRGRGALPERDYIPIKK